MFAFGESDLPSSLGATRDGVRHRPPVPLGGGPVFVGRISDPTRIPFLTRPYAETDRHISLPSKPVYHRPRYGGRNDSREVTACLNSHNRLPETTSTGR
jgi:hypothetical protein